MSVLQALRPVLLFSATALAGVAVIYFGPRG